MDILSPLILLHENGYKALTATDGVDNWLPVTLEPRSKVVRVEKGGLDVAGRAGQVRLDHNQGEPQMAQKVIDVVGTSKESFAKAAENAVAEAAKTVRGMKWARVAEFEMELDGQKIAQYRTTTKIYFDVEK
jgi:dodecin